MSMYKITRLTSEKENQRLSQLAQGPFSKGSLYNQLINQKSDDDKEIGGVNSAALSAMKLNMLQLQRSKQLWCQADIFD